MRSAGEMSFRASSRQPARELFISREAGKRGDGTDGPADGGKRDRGQRTRSASRKAARGAGTVSKYGAKERESRLSVRTSESVYP